MSIKELMEAVKGLREYTGHDCPGDIAYLIADALTAPSPITRDDCKGWRKSIDNDNFTKIVNETPLTITFWGDRSEAFIGSAPANPPLETKGDLWQALLRLNRKDK